MVGPNYRVTRADVKNFFVVDKHQYPAKMAVSILNAKDRHVVERNSLFLLRSQFVRSTLIEVERFFQS